MTRFVPDLSPPPHHLDEPQTQIMVALGQEKYTSTEFALEFLTDKPDDEKDVSDDIIDMIASGNITPENVNIVTEACAALKTTREVLSRIVTQPKSFEVSVLEANAISFIAGILSTQPRSDNHYAQCAGELNETLGYLQIKEDRQPQSYGFSYAYTADAREQLESALYFLPTKEAIVDMMAKGEHHQRTIQAAENAVDTTRNVLERTLVTQSSAVSADEAMAISFMKGILSTQLQNSNPNIAKSAHKLSEALLHMEIEPDSPQARINQGRLEEATAKAATL